MIGLAVLMLVTLLATLSISCAIVEVQIWRRNRKGTLRGPIYTKTQMMWVVSAVFPAIVLLELAITAVMLRVSG